MGLQDKLGTLADNFRSYFNKTDKLSLDDMITLLSTDTIIIIAKNSFSIIGGYPVDRTDLIQLGATINNNKSAWGQIVGLEMTGEKALAYANDSKYTLKLHLYITEMENSGAAWLKWDDTNNKTEFMPKMGEALV